MKALFALALSFLFASSAQAQDCDGYVGASRIPITQDTVLSGASSYWICSGVTVAFTEFGFALVEEGCNVIISGDMGNYSFKSNCVVTFTATASNNMFVYDSSTTIVDNGSNNYPNICAEVTFNYANAPVGGCDITASVPQNKAGSFAIYPNPAHGTLHITGAAGGSVRILDLTGREVLHSSIAEGQVDISAVPPGSYLVRLVNGALGLTERIVVF